MLADDLDTDTIWDDLSFLLESVVISLNEMGESVLSGDENLHTAWELELGSSQGLLGELDMVETASDGHDDLSNLHSGRLTESLTESTSHTLLESISTSA